MQQYVNFDTVKVEVLCFDWDPVSEIDFRPRITVNIDHYGVVSIMGGNNFRRCGLLQEFFASFKFRRQDTKQDALLSLSQLAGWVERMLAQLAHCFIISQI